MLPYNGQSVCMGLAVHKSEMPALSPLKGPAHMPVTGDSSLSLQPIHAAATLILARPMKGGHEVLMGQRGASAVFMPSKFVFPGGRVDKDDHYGGSLPLDATCIRRLGPKAPALTAAALRELDEEAGLRFTPQALEDQNAPPLRFVFRAITPPGRSRRFDARFFLADGGQLAGDPADFSRADDELSYLQWVDLRRARDLDLPYITEIVLAEVSAILTGHLQPGVPFFDNSTNTPAFRRIL